MRGLPGRRSLKDRIHGIKMLILDVDGVMTDGGIILGPGSMELKRFDARDGMGIALARAAGSSALISRWT